MTREPLPLKFRLISSIVEWTDPNNIFNDFGIISSDLDRKWIPITGRIMLALTPTELRNLADVIEKR